ncbi:tyrosine-type recombinase/integrase [Enterococcus sp. BWT-B8]|uniref:tyrosine-type recombinase/integrase n=1 Tax=Enterococcus sp. BWT-B8 TaxID=2885157 RepID=UPI002A0AB9DB|nr:tyrosine-type recombinase/integrase [Enterococcus sp. BWT-B8]MCB5953284.1 tyrosine-type recombinase/integrase [Enterococcus sp. BWT-B8]
MCVHTDFLNYRINKIKSRHPELTHISPHMLRHTSTTPASIGGMSISELSKALTHTDISTTKIYTHNPDVVPQTPAEFIYENIEQK